jgi:hypothetical protein
MTLAPILISFSLSVVSDQFLIGPGVAKLRRKLPGCRPAGEAGAARRFSSASQKLRLPQVRRFHFGQLWALSLAPWTPAAFSKIFAPQRRVPVAERATKILRD